MSLTPQLPSASDHQAPFLLHSQHFCFHVSRACSAIWDLVSTPSCWKGDTDQKQLSRASRRTGNTTSQQRQWTRGHQKGWHRPGHREDNVAPLGSTPLIPGRVCITCWAWHQAALGHILVNLQSSHLQTDTVRTPVSLEKGTELNNVIKWLGCRLNQV